MEVMETIKDFPDTGNIVFDYLFTALMLFLQAYLWCVDKILKYPVVTAIFLIVVLILAIINDCDRNTRQFVEVEKIREAR